MIVPLFRRKTHKAMLIYLQFKPKMSCRGPGTHPFCPSRCTTYVAKSETSTVRPLAMRSSCLTFVALAASIGLALCEPVLYLVPPEAEQRRAIAQILAKFQLRRSSITRISICVEQDVC